MNEPEPDAGRPLTKQRADIGRYRLAALIMMIGWGALAVAQAVTLDVDDPMDWVFLSVAIVVMIAGVKVWFDYRRKLRAFEDQHGPDAGRQ